MSYDVQSNPSYQPTERRPIAARRWPIWQRVTQWLVRRGITANVISLIGMGCGILAGAALAATSWGNEWERAFWLAGGALIQMRLLANLLDGMVAVEAGQASAVGELYNEVPDRVSDTSTLIGAGYALGGDVILGYLAACAALFTAYVRATGKAAGAPQEYCGPMAKQQRMALMTFVAGYCALAPAGWRPTWEHLGERSVAAMGLIVIIIGCLLTAVRRLTRIAANLRASQP